MATQGNGVDLGTLVASADLSAKQFRFVDVNSDGKVALAAAHAKAIGVLQNKPSADGHSATVRISGVSKVVSGAAVAAGAQVASDANAAAVTAAAGDLVQGRALAAASGAGEVIPVLLQYDRIPAA